MSEAEWLELLCRHIPADRLDLARPAPAGFAVTPVTQRPKSAAPPAEAQAGMGKLPGAASELAAGRARGADSQDGRIDFPSIAKGAS